jgi:hypothetical protein
MGYTGFSLRKFFLSVLPLRSQRGDANPNLKGEGSRLFICDLNAISVFSQ